MAKQQKETVDERAFRLHSELLEAEVGKERASSANVGWGVNEYSDGGMSIATKVYGGRPIVFTTEHDADGDIQEAHTEDY